MDNAVIIGQDAFIFICPWLTEEVPIAEDCLELFAHNIQMQPDVMLNSSCKAVSSLFGYCRRSEAVLLFATSHLLKCACS